MEATVPRETGYWNNIPVTIKGGMKSRKVLAAWGIRPWATGFGDPTKKFGEELDYVGWQRVHLPEGWTLSFEHHDFFLLDNKNQVRASIHRALEHKKSEGLFGADFSEKLAEALKDDPATKKRNKLPPGPYLELRTAITFRSSFSLGDNGPYSMWIENPLGEEIFGYRNVEIPPNEQDSKLAKLKSEIELWLKENYPRWQSPYFYWDRFA